MIYNVPPICKKPVTVFDGVVRGNGEVYTGNLQFTNDFKYQCESGEPSRKIVAGYEGGSGYTYICQFNGYVQLFGADGEIGASDNDGGSYSPWGIYINNPIQLTNKKKLTINAAHSYYGTGSSAVLTNVAPIRAYLFSNIYENMYSNNVRSVEVPSYPAFDDGIYELDKEIIIPHPEEIVLDVSNISGEFYIGFSVDRSESSVMRLYYLTIGEIVAF